MSRRRHTVNPSKARLDARAARPGQAGDGPGIAAGGPALRGRLTALLLSMLSVALLAVSFAPANLWPVAYVALVPWTLGILAAPTRRWALVCAAVSGLAGWALAVYWLVWVTLVGYFSLVAFLALFWVAAAAILRPALRRGWPAWAALPVVWVGLETARAYIISGFPWFNLGNSQYAVTPLIQIADVTSEAGVSFFVAMANGAIVDRLAPWVMRRVAGNGATKQVGWGILSRSLGFTRVGEIATAVTAVFLLCYGAYRLNERTQTEGPVIGLVQGAFPIALQRRGATAEAILDFHLGATRAMLPARIDANTARPDLVVWPETMLPSGMNADVLNADVERMDPHEQRRLLECFGGPGVWGEQQPDGSLRPYPDWLMKDLLVQEINGGARQGGTPERGRRPMAGQVRAMAGEIGCPILAGGATFHPNRNPVDDREGWLKRNTALWFEPNAAAPERSYSKMHLVPFSEYVPFRDSWRGLHKLLRVFVPAVMPQLQPGERTTVFELKRPGGANWRLVTPICYEGTFSRVCRELMKADGGKAADIIVNMSNDGWFVCPWGEGRRGSFEQAQHLSHYTFRAIENRSPVVRAVNTGISASVDSNGRIVATVSHPAQPQLRTMLSGTLLLDGQRKNEKEFAYGHGPKVLVDGRVSWYSRIGDLFAAVVFAAAAAMTVRLAWGRAAKLEGAGH